MSKDEYTDIHLKHMDYVQSAIARMSAQSATQKNYCITLVTAIVGASFVTQTSGLIYIAMLATVIFGFVDAKYLQVERGFRDLYDEVRRVGAGKSVDFRMTPHSSSYLASIVSWSILPFYLSILIGIAALNWILL